MERTEFYARLEVVGASASTAGVANAEVTVWAADADEATQELDRVSLALRPVLGGGQLVVNDAEWYG